MKHAHFHKNELLSVADIHAVASLYHMEVPSALTILSLDAFNGICSAVDGRVRDLLHESRQRTGVVTLAMICHNEIDLMKVDLFLQIVHKIKTVRRPYSIDQDRLFLFDQVSVLAGTVHDAVIVTVETLQFPINIADPADISLYMLSHAKSPLCFFNGPDGAVVFCFSSRIQSFFRHIHIDGNCNAIIAHGKYVGACSCAQTAANAAVIYKILHRVILLIIPVSKAMPS